MLEEPGLMFVRWTVRIAVACYAVRVLADAADVGSPRLRRSVWTAGLVFYLLHVAAAFQFVHHWSHRAAWIATARQTADLTGWESGDGLRANYAFTLLWMSDAVAWWIVGPDYPQRFRRIGILVQTVFAFFVFHATVVFGPPGWRGVAATFALLLAAAWVRRARRSFDREESVKLRDRTV